MPKKGHSEEQILRALWQAEAGAKVSGICREFRIINATFTSGRRNTRDWA
jgi:hypothetical protein